MGAKFLRFSMNASWPRERSWHWLVVLGLGASIGVFDQALAAPDRQRVDWEKLTPEQQLAAKASPLQGKAAATMGQKYYVYQNGQRTNLEVQGDGALAVFRLVGSGTDLRNVGRGSITLSAPKTPLDLKAALEPHGVQLGAPLDTEGLVWTVQTRAGLEGIKTLNQLKESGLVVGAAPDWQRDLRKK
jgi:hypothetical protein